MSIYKSKGKTAQEAFCGIWDLLKYTDDAAMRKVGNEWEIRVKIVKPTKKERKEFEQDQSQYLSEKRGKE